MADNTLTINIEGLDKLIKNFEESPAIVEAIMQEAIVRAGLTLETHTDQSTVPFIRGDLIRSFKPIEIGRLYARWFPRANYARAVQFGMPSSPGRFVPAIGKRLKNGSNIGTWPGFKGRFYMEKIIDASNTEIKDIFSRALEDVARAMGGEGGAGKTPTVTTPSGGGGGSGPRIITGGGQVKGTTSKFSGKLYKRFPKIAAKIDRLTYRPFKGAPRGYQARLGQKFPRLFKRWKI